MPWITPKFSVVMCYKEPGSDSHVTKVFEDIAYVLIQNGKLYLKEEWNNFFKYHEYCYSFNVEDVLYCHVEGDGFI